MRSPHHPDERDLDVAGLRRAAPQMTSVKKGHGGRRGRRGIGRYVLGGLIALVLALFSGVIWFAYQDLMPGGDEAPPLIRAEASPIKREPVERGGLPLVNEDSAVVQSLDEPDSPVRVERIVPRETAAPRSTADVIPQVLEAEPRSDTDLVIAHAALDPASDADLDPNPDLAAASPGDSLDTLLAEIVDREADAMATAGGLGVEPAAGPMTGEQVPLPADGIALPERELAALPAPPASSSVTTAPATSAAPTPAPAAIPAPPPAVAAPAPSPAPTSTPPATARPAAPAQSSVAQSSVAQSPVAQSPVAQSPVAQSPVAQSPVAQPPAAAVTPRATAPAETTVAALPSPALAQDFRGAFGVQLLAVREEAAAAGAWTGLQQRHPSVLGNLRSRVQRAEIGGNTFYRLQAGPFADRAGAMAVCSALQAQGTDCFIVEPTT